MQKSINMLVKIEARILIFPGTDFHFPSTSVPTGTFLRLCPYLCDGRSCAGRPRRHLAATGSACRRSFEHTGRNNSRRQSTDIARRDDTVRDRQVGRRPGDGTGIARPTDLQQVHCIEIRETAGA